MLTLDALRARDLPATVPFSDAASALGMGRTAAYSAKREGRFPVPVIELGHRFVVPTAPLLRVLGVEGRRDEGAATSGADTPS